MVHNDWDDSEDESETMDQSVVSSHSEEEFTITLTGEEEDSSEAKRTDPQIMQDRFLDLFAGFVIDGPSTLPRHWTAVRWPRVRGEPVKWDTTVSPPPDSPEDVVPGLTLGMQDDEYFATVLDVMGKDLVVEASIIMAPPIQGEPWAIMFGILNTYMPSKNLRYYSLQNPADMYGSLDDVVEIVEQELRTALESGVCWDLMR